MLPHDVHPAKPASKHRLLFFHLAESILGPIQQCSHRIPNTISESQEILIVIDQLSVIADFAPQMFDTTRVEIIRNE
jgi:hypothetical protein